MTELLKQRVCITLMLAILMVPLQTVVAAVDNISNQHCMMPGCEHSDASSQNMTMNQPLDNSQLQQSVNKQSDCQNDMSCEIACQDCGHCQLMVISSVLILPPTKLTTRQPYVLSSVVTYIANLDTPPPTFYL